MTTITKPTYDSFLDERHLAVWESPAGKRHVEGWFSQTLCGSFLDRSRSWRWRELTSLRYLGRLANGNADGVWCKRCLNNYRGMNV
jgi:hypothetical protein